jgi:hypothetical protein
VVSQALECQQGPADAYDALAHVSALLGQHERWNALYRRTRTLFDKDTHRVYQLRYVRISSGL